MYLYIEEAYGLSSEWIIILSVPSHLLSDLNNLDEPANADAERRGPDQPFIQYERKNRSF